MQVKSNPLLYSLYYAEACDEFAGPICSSLHSGNTAPLKEMSQWWRVVGNTVSDMTGPKFEPQTSRSRDERATARPTGRYCCKSTLKLQNIGRGMFSAPFWNQHTLGREKSFLRLN